MRFVFLLAIYGDLGCDFSAINLTERARLNNATIFVTTESPSRTALRTYRSLIRMPELEPADYSALWTISGTPSPRMYTLGQYLGQAMYAAQQDIHEKAVGLKRGCVSPFDIIHPRMSLDQATSPGYSGHSLGLASPRHSCVDRVCDDGNEQSSISTIFIGDKFTTRHTIHNVSEASPGVLHISHRVQQQNVDAYIYHPSCIYRDKEPATAGDTGHANSQQKALKEL